MHSPDKIGRYEVLMPLGRGRHLARARGVSGFERRVEIQTVPAGDESAKRFVDSARVFANLHHQHVAAVFELGAEGDELFLVREYVHGRSLGQVWQHAREREATLPYDFALTVAMAAADALERAAAPRAGTMEHLMIGFEGAVKLTTLGISHAPEYVLGLPADVRTDVFALGTLLYELSTMRHAFLDASERITTERLRSATYQAPSKVVPGYPRALEQIVARALQLAPEARFADPATLRRELSAVARRLRLVVGDAAVAEVMAQLYDDRREPWLRPATADDDELTSARGGPPSKPRVHVRSVTETVDALVSDQDAGESEDGAAATREMRPAVLTPPPRHSFDSGAVTTISDDPVDASTDPTSPQPYVDSIEPSDPDLPPLATQVTAVPPPPEPRPGGGPPLATGSAPPGVHGSLPPADAKLAARLATTMPPMDAAVLLASGAMRIEEEPAPTAPPDEPAPPLPTVPGPPPAPSSPPPPLAPVAHAAPAVPAPVRRAPTRKKAIPTAPASRRGVLIVAIVIGAVLGVGAVALVLFLDLDAEPTPTADAWRPAPPVAVAPPPTHPPQRPPAAQPDASVPVVSPGDAGATPPAADAATAARDAAAGDAAASDAAATTTVRLQITTQPPGATVLLDKRRLGKTPFDEPVEAEAGKHTLKIRRPGYNSVRFEIELTADVRRAIDLVPAEPQEKPPDDDAGVF